MADRRKIRKSEEEEEKAKKRSKKDTKKKEESEQEEDEHDEESAEFTDGESGGSSKEKEDEKSGGGEEDEEEEEEEKDEESIELDDDEIAGKDDFLDRLDKLANEDILEGFIEHLTEKIRGGQLTEAQYKWLFAHNSAIVNKSLDGLSRQERNAIEAISIAWDQFYTQTKRACDSANKASQALDKLFDTVKACVKAEPDSEMDD